MKHTCSFGCNRKVERMKCACLVANHHLMVTDPNMQMPNFNHTHLPYRSVLTGFMV